MNAPSTGFGTLAAARTSATYFHVTDVADAVRFRKAFPLATFQRVTRDSRPGAVAHWKVPFSDAEALVQWGRDVRATLAPEIVTYADRLWRAELDARVRSTSASSAAIPSVGGLTSTLLPAQRVVLSAIPTCWVRHPADANKRTHRALLVADEPGLGKTIMGLASVRLTGLEAARTIVICPTSLTDNWRTEMTRHFADGTFRPWTATGQTPSPIPEDCDVVVIGWDVLRYWSETLIAWKPDALLSDETHFAKSGRQKFKTEDVPVVDADGERVRDESGNLKIEKVSRAVSGSARSTASLDIGKAVARRHGLVVALTGTPIVSRPLELFPLLDYIGILHLFGGEKAYKDRYCDPKTKTINGTPHTSYNGASNLLELNDRLAASGHYIRRTKEVLVTAGVLKRKYVDGAYIYDRTSTPHPWEIAATRSEMAAYRACWQEQSDFFTERAREIAATLGIGMNTQRVQAKVANEGSKHLERIVALRKAAGLTKVPYVIERVTRLVEQGEKVVIAAHHKEVVTAYAEAFTGLKIQGGMTVKATEEVKRLFNETPLREHPVLTLSVDAGKTGHTLCKQAMHGVGPACAHMILAEQIWTPADEGQVQDRIYRVGQDRDVRIVNALLTDSIDREMYEQRQEKWQVVNAAVDAIDPDMFSETTSSKRGAALIAQRLVYGRTA